MLFALSITRSRPVAIEKALPAFDLLNLSSSTEREEATARSSSLNLEISF